MANQDGKVETVGREYTVKELIREAEKDRVFYEQSGGGITLSGGEALVQDTELLASFLGGCKRVGIATAVDTSGAVSYDRFEKVLPVTDLFLYDIKLLDDQAHVMYTGCGNQLILDNLIRLSRAGAAVNLRLPLLRGINDSDADMEKLADFIARHGVRIQSVNLLPYHEFGRQKYAGLGRQWQRFQAPDDETLERHRAFWEGLGILAAIGGASAI